jgi:hypothetical protein
MARLKQYHVSLKFSGPYRTWDGHTGMPGDPPKELHGEYNKTGTNGKWMRRISTEIYLDGQVEDVIKLIRRAAEGLQDAVVNIDTREIPYEDHSEAYNTISGVREATPEEIAWIQRQIKIDEEAEQKRVRTEIETLKLRIANLEGS